MTKGCDLPVGALGTEGVDRIFGKPDFVACAESCGAKSHRMTSAEAPAPTREAAFAAGGVHLVTVPVEGSKNTRVLVADRGGHVPQVEPV